MIDTGIYNNLLRRPKSVAEYDAEAMAGQQNKLALQMSQAKMSEYQRGIEQENALGQAYKDSTGTDGKIDRNKLFTSVAQSGQGSKLPGIQKGFSDQDKADLEAGKAKLEAGLKQYEAMAQIMSGVRDQASYDAARQQAMQVMGPEAAARIPPVYNPADVEAGRLKAMGIKDQMEMHYKEVAAELASNKFKYDQTNDTANRNVTIRGQDQSAASAAAGRAQSDRHHNDNKTQAAKPPAGYRNNPDGSMSAIPGGPADLKNNAESVKAARDAESVLSLLDEADLLLPQGTNGYVGTGVDKLLGVGGLSTAGGNASAQLRAIEGGLISKMPKMSGPQSDKDVLLYKQMAGQVGDSTIPREQRQAASKIIRKLNEKHAGRPTPPPPTVPIQLKTAADYAKVPSGAEFITPDGKTMRKK